MTLGVCQCDGGLECCSKNETIKLQGYKGCMEPLEKQKYIEPKQTYAYLHLLCNDVGMYYVYAVVDSTSAMFFSHFCCLSLWHCHPISFVAN